MARFIKFQDGTKKEVQNIYCLGRNYVDHIIEMKANLGEKPVIFTKPTTAIPTDKELEEGIVLPYFSSDIHHEIELVFSVSKPGYRIPKKEALDYVDSFGVGLDLTLRDIQETAKEKRQPWDISKGFKSSAPLSEFIKFKDITSDKTAFLKQGINFKLEVNGHLRQSGNSKSMNFSFEEILEYVSGIFELEEGDLIFTGTPGGVDRLSSGDVAVCKVENLISCEFKFK